MLIDGGLKVFEKVCDCVDVFVGKENTFNNGALLFVQQCALQEPKG